MAVNYSNTRKPITMTRTMSDAINDLAEARGISASKLVCDYMGDNLIAAVEQQLVGDLRKSIDAIRNAGNSSIVGMLNEDYSKYKDSISFEDYMVKENLDMLCNTNIKTRNLIAFLKEDFDIELKDVWHKYKIKSNEELQNNRKEDLEKEVHLFEKVIAKVREEISANILDNCDGETPEEKALNYLLKIM